MLTCAFDSPEVETRNTQGGTFVIGVKCKVCGTIRHGGSKDSIDAAFDEAKASADKCCFSRRRK